MNRISDILARKGNDAISVSPSTTVFEALKLMAEKNIGSVIVEDHGNYVGIVTERDYSRKVILKGKNSEHTLVADIMSIDLPHLTPQDSIEHCMSLMSNNKIRYMPVFENEKLVGIISITDVVKQTISTQQDTIDHLKNYINSGS